MDCAEWDPAPRNSVRTSIRLMHRPPPRSGIRWIPGLIVILTAALAGTTGPSGQQASVEREHWNKPVEPFRIIGNVYYVGAAGVSAFLVTSPAGSILLDGGLPETAPQLARNIAALGFRLADVKYLLNSHAHFDHAGGLAELKRLSGAAVIASAGDAGTLRAGSADMPAVPVDRIVRDGDRVEVGGTTLAARVTPGHTRGCTTWTTTVADAGRTYNVVFYCSTSVVDRLVGNTGYPEIVSDYEQSFRVLRTLQSDVFLGPHPMFFQLDAKRQRMRTGSPNPFVDPGELRRFVDESERQFRAELKKQQTER
jgi:metallo-beta-lactamase class B